MSPQLRSMLEGAADDSGRPVPDLEAILTGGRRAVRHRRAVAGGMAAGVTAVVAAVAITVSTVGGTPADFAGDDAALESAGLSQSLAPLIEAIEDAGYTVQLDGQGMSGDGTVAVSRPDDGSEGVSGSVSTRSFTMSTAGAEGSLVVSDFTTIELLSGVVPEPTGPSEPGSSVGYPCAVTPPVPGEAVFRWAPCETEALGDGEVWWSEGNGEGVRAVGATVVRADRSGFSIALGSPTELGWFSYETPPPTLPSADLPLTDTQLADLVTGIEAAGGSVFTEAPAQVTPQGVPVAYCDGDVLATVSDDHGRTELVDHLGITSLCSYGVGASKPTDVANVTEVSSRQKMVRLPDPDESGTPWSFRPDVSIGCYGTPCVFIDIGYGEVPAGVARITFVMADGQEVDAKIGGRLWLLRITAARPAAFERPTSVRLYDAAGKLLAVGEQGAQGSASPS